MNLALALVVAVVVSQVATFATTIYLHRALSHRALRLHPAAEMGFRIVLWLTTGIKPRQWVAVHRYHHATSDTEDDPHSPLYQGFWRVQLGNAVLYRHALKDGVLVRKYARDLPPDRLDRLAFDRGFLGLGIGITVLVLLLGWQTGLVAAVLHTALYLLLNAAINAVGHMWGRRPYDNVATNNQWLALITAGEGLHNNHHAAPTSARLALDRGQIDPAWFVILGLVRLRLAEVRHDLASVRGRLEEAA
ncbi:MAG TPA: fatty acid desaturase [Acidimicrobiia bacterium]|nr:fatty acid desaturase [Acidimicrobiia bacterium]